MVTEQEKMLTIKEAAKEARRTAETVRRWVWSGRLPAQKLGNQLFIKKSDLDAVVAKTKNSDMESRRRALADAAKLREKIARRIGGTLDVVALVDESRASH